MSIDPLAPPERGFDLEDLAVNFLEQEVGRHDWRNNWLKMRREQDMVKHAAAWAKRYELNVDPRELVTWLDDYVRRTRGVWN